MMAEKEMRNQFRSAITAATVCCRMPVSDETSSITQYLKSLLDTALDGAGQTTSCDCVGRKKSAAALVLQRDVYTGAGR